MRLANEVHEIREKVKAQEEEIKRLKLEVKEEKAKRRRASRTGLFSRSIALDVRIRGEKHVSRDSACCSCIALVDQGFSFCIRLSLTLSGDGKNFCPFYLSLNPDVH